jgi:DNA-binding PadR family transcriptional regulator
MSNDNFSRENFERFLSESAPDLKELLEQESELSPERVAKLKTMMEAHRAFLRELSKAQMRQVILELFKACPLDGTHLVAMLRKNNVQLKDASGEGEFFGLLREMENTKVIAGEWKDGDERRKKVYKLTDLGRAEISPVTSKEAELAQWLLSRASA